MYFFQQGRYELIFRHALQHLAVRKDDAHSLAAGDAEIGFPRFAGTVDDAAHDGDFNRHRYTGQGFLYFLGQAD